MADRHGKLTEAQVVEIIDRYAAGRATCRQLAAEYGVSPQAISNIVRRKAWASVDGRSSDEMQALMPLAKGKARALEIIDRYAAGGVTQAELAAEYGMAKQSVSKILRRLTWAEIDAPSATDRRAARNAEIAARYAAGGVTQAELAAEYGMSSQNIARIIRRSLATTADAVPHR